MRQRVIHKHNLAIFPGLQKVGIVRGARFLHVALDPSLIDYLGMWWEVPADTDVTEVRSFEVYGTGGTVTSEAHVYLGTVIQPDQWNGRVWHVYERENI